MRERTKTLQNNQTLPTFPNFSENLLENFVTRKNCERQFVSYKDSHQIWKKKHACVNAEELATEAQQTCCTMAEKIGRTNDFSFHRLSWSPVRFLYVAMTIFMTAFDCILLITLNYKQSEVSSAVNFIQSSKGNRPSGFISHLWPTLLSAPN